MNRTLKPTLAALLTLVLAQPADAIDLSPGSTYGAALREQGLQRSQAAQFAVGLADDIGGRLSGSPDMRRAYGWAIDTLTGLGLQDPRLDDCGEFGLSWQQDSVSARMLAPSVHQLAVVAVPWSAASEGPLRGEVTLLAAGNAAELARHEGTLGGKIVLLGAPPAVGMPFAPFATRKDDAELASGTSMAAVRQYYAGRADRLLRLAEEARFSRELGAFLAREGVRAVILPSSGGQDGVGSGVLGTDDSGAPGGLNWVPGVRPPFPMLRTTAEDYGRMARLVEAGEPVEVELALDAQVLDEREHLYNVIADLPATDPAHADEYVLIGAHLDSWPGAAGAVDNAAGVAIAIEAMRLLKASAIPLRRSVRLVLYAGEEQGLICSGAYADRYLGTIPRSRTPDQLEIHVPQWRTPVGLVAPGPEYALISAALNVDSGSGRIRGLMTGGDNPDLAGMLRAWLPELADLGVDHVFDEPDWPADQVSFTTIGLPGLSLVQDPLDYGRARHGHMDTSERLSPDDLAQASVALAAIVARMAAAEQLMPRPRAPFP